MPQTPVTEEDVLPTAQARCWPAALPGWALAAPRPRLGPGLQGSAKHWLSAKRQGLRRQRQEISAH